MRGETLFSIARKYQTTPEAVQKLNGLPTPRIKVGQRIVVKATS
jgi:LysM repeat protein